MASLPRNQAEALTFIKRREKELFDKKLFESESETVDFLSWAELPTTKKIRKKLEQTREKFQDYFESQKWKDEAEARGLAYSMKFLDVLEKLVSAYKKKYENIQTQKKQKEG